MRALLAANWKMNPLSAEEAEALAGGVVEAAKRFSKQVEVALLPPFPWLTAVAARLCDTGLGVGAQDCHWEPSGAYTGEVSAAMLAGWCGWVIAGHSERRQLLGETDEQVARKARAALEAGLQVIACVGETEAQHDAGEVEEVVSGQVRAITSALGGLEAAVTGGLVLAYEPVWAIGGGRNADPEHAFRVLRLARRAAAEALGEAAARRLRLLYGGSVKADNVGSYVELPNCDGCLVGGASLKAEEFSSMIAAVAETYGYVPPKGRS